MFTIYIDTFIRACVFKYVTMFINTLFVYFTKLNKNYGKIYELLNFFYYGDAIIPYFR